MSATKPLNAPASVDGDNLAAEVRDWIADSWNEQLKVREWWRRLAESGWGYPTWPTEWYGRSLDSDSAAIVRAELKAAGVLPPPHGIGQTMGAPVILEFGTEEQKQRFLPKIATGEEAWCQFFSEPDAGSDLASLTTRAVRDGDEWVVTGQKVWNSGTLTADRAVLPARTNLDVPKHRGISFFIIDVKQPGIEVRPIEQMNGESHFNETFFNDARVPHENLIGEVDKGWGVTLATLANERSAYAAGADYGGGAAVGEQGGMLDLTCAEAFRRMQASDDTVEPFPLGNAEALIELAREYGCADDPIIRDRITRLYCRAETARLTALRAKAAADAGRAPGPESSLGYISGVHLARATRDLGLAIVGAGGMLAGRAAPRDGAVTHMALSSLVHGIQGGTEQIQRNIVGERVLGLPKEPQVDRDIAFKETPEEPHLMSFELGRLAQVIHVTDDLPTARRFYRDVLGGEVYYEGYSPFEKRDASIYAIGDLTIEPMSPSDEPGALDYPVGRFLTRFGPRFHSLAINAVGVRELADHLVGAGIRVVGPGGIPLSELSDDGPVAIYTHPRDSHVLIEFVDFGAPLMPASPRLAPDWDARRRAEAHPAGVLGPSHATVLVADLDRALALFTDVLGVPTVDAPSDVPDGRRASVRVGTETVIEFVQPTDPASESARSLAADGEGLYSLTLDVIDVDRCAAHLDAQGVEATRARGGGLHIEPASTAGARLVMVEAPG